MKVLLFYFNKVGVKKPGMHDKVMMQEHQLRFWLKNSFHYFLWRREVIPCANQITMDIRKIRELIAAGDTSAFYNDRRWRKLAAAVRQEQHNECYYCRLHGKVTTATHVHHVKELKQYPELAYSRTYTDPDGTVRPNLLAVCHNCHETQHPNRLAGKNQRKKLINIERW